jgi:hypothetical protein
MTSPSNPPMKAMSMRDYIAALVIQGLTAHGGMWNKQQMSMLAEYAYAQSDAMLAQREKDALI